MAVPPRTVSPAMPDVERGRLVARALWRAWDPTEPAPQLTREELAAIVPRFMAGGGGAVLWWRLRASPLRGEPMVEELLRPAYRKHALEAALHDRSIARLFARFREAGVEPLAAKGWAVARYYPEPGLRPYGDLDITVRPAHYEAARALLPTLVEPELNVDLHARFGQLADRPVEDLFARSALVPLGATEVRVLAPEDHLRLLALHMFGHGAMRPLWLCDLGAVMAKLPPGFDWAYSSGGDPRKTDAVVAALALARELLGAPLDAAPPAIRDRRPPRWLVPATLAAWGSEEKLVHGRRVPFRARMTGAREVLGALRERWPNEIEATALRGAPFDDRPRLPYQLLECAARGLAWARGR